MKRQWSGTCPPETEIGRDKGAHPGASGSQENGRDVREVPVSPTAALDKQSGWGDAKARIGSQSTVEPSFREESEVESQGPGSESRFATEPLWGCRYPDETVGVQV